MIFLTQSRWQRSRRKPTLRRGYSPRDKALGSESPIGVRGDPGLLLGLGPELHEGASDQVLLVCWLLPQQHYFLG